ncbi:MAG: nitrogen regulation protein NR(I) [Burkholderiaceae bacterium]
MTEVWIVDDDQSIRWVLERALEKEGFAVRSFDSAGAVDDAMQSAVPGAVISDIRMPGGSGLELLERLRRRAPELPVIIMTAYSDLDSAVSAFQGGAFDYLPKPFDLGQAVELIRRALAEHEGPAPLPADNASRSQEMLGQAPAMQEVFRAIGRLSQSSATVLVTGESGTGKELIARALHRHSARSSKPFVALNMAAIPRDLLESELFGHERGSFTGAQQQRRGRFEQAEGGTLFLDEIGDMPAELQTRLLRVLSEGNFYRVGGQAPIRTQARVIAATHQDLESRVSRGLFREDLYHRLNVIRLRLPPLRERTEDVAPLVQHFLARSAAELGVEPKRLSVSALDRLAAFDWPGNVRQLENVCNWLMVMAPAQTISGDDLPAEIVARARGPASAAPAAAADGSAGEATSDTALGASGGAVAGDASAGSGSGAGVRPPGPLFIEPGALQTGYPGIAPASSGTETNAVPGTAAPAVGPAAAASGAVAGDVIPPDWSRLLAQEASRRLAQAHDDPLPPAGEGLMNELTRRFEATLIRAALEHTGGRRVEASLRLGIGRNTLTRKIQELGIDDA